MSTSAVKGVGGGLVEEPTAAQRSAGAPAAEVGRLTNLRIKRTIGNKTTSLHRHSQQPHHPSHKKQGTPSVLPSNATSGPDAVNPAHIPHTLPHIQAETRFRSTARHLHFQDVKVQMRPRARCASMCARVPRRYLRLSWRDYSPRHALLSKVSCVH